MAATIGAARIEMSINSAEFTARMKRMAAEVGKFRASLVNTERNFLRWGRNLERTGRSMTQNFTLPAIAAGGAAIKSAIDFESAFAGVRKTVDATEKEFATLRASILAMSKQIPASANEIAGIAEAAGQLGIQNQNIMSFTRVMADLGVATNMASDQAATALARLANITQMNQADFDRLGSTVVELGNNLATTEAEIVEMAQRLAGSAKQAGLAESEILGFAAALSSVGIEAQAGGTAFSKVFDQINLAVQTSSDELADFARVAGMSSEQFAAAFSEDAASAVVAFVEGLGDMEQQGGSAIATLERMGITERRLRDALLRASGAGDLFRRSIETGNRAWAENVALSEEAAQRYQTVMSRLKILRNRITALAISVGDALMPAIEGAIDMVGRATSSFENLSSEAKVQILSIAALFAGAGPFVWAMGRAAKIVAGLVKFVRGRFAIMAAGVGLVVTAGQWLVDNWRIFAAELEQIWKGQQMLALGTARRIAQAFKLASMPGTTNAIQFTVAEEAIKGLIKTTKDEINNLQRFQQNLGLTTFAQSAGRAWENFTGTIENLLGMAIEGTPLEDFLEGMKGSFEASDQAARSLTQALEKMQGGVASRGLPSMGIGVPDGELRRAEARFSSIRDAMGQTAEKAMVMGQALQSSATNAVTSFAETLGNAFTGDAGAKGFFNNLLTIVADFTQQFGKLLVAAGTAALAFKNLLANPVAAIIAGGALIAASTAVKNLLRRGPEQESRAQGMAQGGIVPPGFPNDSYPALLSSGERVIPKPMPLSAGTGTGLSKRDMIDAFSTALAGARWKLSGSELVLVTSRGKKSYA